MNRVTPLALVKSRRMWPLALSQSCTALSDNVVRNALIVLALFRLHEGGAGFAALAGALFMAPFLVFCVTFGKLADRFAKRQVILAAKAGELALMLGAAGAFMSGNIPALFAVLFGLGLQAALFAPVKLGILPELLAEEELVAGNGIMEGAVFVSIVLGTIAGGALMLAPHGAALVSAAGIAISATGVAAALAIPRGTAAAPDLRIGWNILGETWRVTRRALQARGIRHAILGMSWFWMLGATLMAELPVMARDVLHADGHALTWLLAVFAAGTGIGALGCARLLKGDVSPRYVPYAALGMSVFMWDFAHACGVAPLSTAALLSTPHGWRVLADMAALTACGGAFSVPLAAIMQDLSPAGERGQVVAAGNVVNSLFMILGACAAAGLAAAGIGPGGVLRLTAAANLLATLVCFRVYAQPALGVLVRAYFGLLHGVTVEGLEHYRREKGRLVLISNHQSFLDAALISAFLPDPPVFAIHTHQMSFWWVKLATAPVKVHPVDIHNNYAIKLLVDAVRDGERVMIFPEGRLTTTGGIMKVYEGAGVVAQKGGARILPLCIDGLQFSRFSRMQGKLRLRWFPRINLRVFPAFDPLPETAPAPTPRAARALIGKRLHDTLADCVFRAADTGSTLFSAAAAAAALHGRKTLIVEDVARTPITFDRLLLGSLALGRRLAAHAPQGGTIGIMMPNATATLVSLIGLSAFGRVSAMLNFTAGAEGMLIACAAARITTVISSRAFVEKAKLGPVVARMEKQIGFVWLEDVRGQIGLREKLRAKLDAARMHRLPCARLSPDSPAITLFTSGSEGAPKGVVLSHRNILANCAQLKAAVDFTTADRVFNALPMFHCLGLVDGTLLPLLNGIHTVLYPSPLLYRGVPATIYDADCTIAFGTDTFLQGWARYAHARDFYRMRYIFAGAEKVREETKRLYAEKFGVRVLEGYGATEASPVIAMNTPHFSRAGTVGKFLPGIEHRLEPVPGIEDGARLLVRGPNIMLGYLRAARPGVIEPQGAWYDTGDIVAVDADGYVAITGRAKRFAKVAGEMISLAGAEALAAALWPDAAHAVVAVADARKGEALVLVTTQAGATAEALQAHARARGAAELGVPRSVRVVSALPVLGTGKTDYPAVQALLHDPAVQAAA